MPDHQRNGEVGSSIIIVLKHAISLSTKHLQCANYWLSLQSLHQ